MTETYQRILQAPAGVPVAEIGSFLVQMDDQNRRLLEDTAGATVDELSWQSQPGMNTIGMLLAHIAIVEVFWLALANDATADCMSVLGIGEDDDGIPLAEDGAPPAALAGKDLAFFAELLQKARSNSYAIGRAWSAADLERRFQRTRKDGNTWTFNVRWVLYHVLEHLAGHYGQVNLLRHEYRASRVTAAAPGAAKRSPHGSA